MLKSCHFNNLKECSFHFLQFNIQTQNIETEFEGVVPPRFLTCKKSRAVWCQLFGRLRQSSQCVFVLKLTKTRVAPAQPGHADHETKNAAIGLIYLEGDTTKIWQNFTTFLSLVHEGLGSEEDIMYHLVDVDRETNLPIQLTQLTKILISSNFQEPPRS